MAVCLLAGCGSRRPATLLVHAARQPIIADGVSRITLRLSATDGRILSPLLKVRVVEGDAHGHAGILSKAASTSLVASFQPGVMPGPVTLRFSDNDVQTRDVVLNAAPALADSFSDGTPDFLRLTTAPDQRAFREWFTLLAERQALEPSGKEITDCAALLRFAYREALRRHDAAWVTSAKLGDAPVPADIAKYTYPHTPLGPDIFRTREGPFQAADLTDGTFSEFAEVKSLVVANTHFIGRDVRSARPGDLLFFRQQEQRSPFHSMIFVGRSHYGPGDDWIVYHTGPNGKWKGEMRRVPLASLMRHPDPRWRPLVTNPNFLGFYRWNILREAN
jgi:uncharacterized protein YfaT (DUF1175 family)